MSSVSDAPRLNAEPLRPHNLVSPSVQKAMEMRETQVLPTVKLDRTLRLGSVPYLNAKPLTYALGSSVITLEPSRLAAELRAGNLDLALVPVMEVLEAPEGAYRVVNDVAIGSERAVYSVYLNHAVPLARIKTVSLDPASRTSAELARLVLEKLYHLTVQYVGPGETADAQLIIGDPAIAYRQAHPEQKYLDLATAWREFTQLPFVFAVWAVRLPVWRAFWTARHLRRAKQIGLDSRAAIAGNAFEREYLNQHLHYELGPPQKRAISLFSEMLAQAGRIAVHHQIRYI